MIARGRTRRTPGTMNGLEKAWSEELKAKRQSGEVLFYEFEAVTLKLAHGRCTYKPDFLVMLKDGTIELHETKGYFEAQAKVKVKVAADKYPMFIFRVIQRRTKKNGGGFEETVMGPVL